MRGELDDALARLARRDELKRRLAAEAPPAPEPPPPAGPTPADEVTAAVREVVSRHPDMAVTLSVHTGASAALLRVQWTAGEVTVTVGPATTDVRAPAATHAPGAATAAPPAWPAGTGQPWTGPADSAATGRSAARLAELIRSDPSLLDGYENER
ncbi:MULTISPECIES: hypothetical protein [Polymorphospora]|uniref:YbaB/EbfC DNA-binding family protein n=1 Tax=Polymorphospora lycopeni TaxID=3140240 RepID=A0ABV5CTE1_9ACTN